MFLEFNPLTIRLKRREEIVMPETLDAEVVKGKAGTAKRIAKYLFIPLLILFLALMAWELKVRELAFSQLGISSSRATDVSRKEEKGAKMRGGIVILPREQQEEKAKESRVVEAGYFSFTFLSCKVEKENLACQMMIKNKGEKIERIPLVLQESFLQIGFNSYLLEGVEAAPPPYVDKKLAYLEFPPSVPRPVKLIFEGYKGEGGEEGSVTLKVGRSRPFYVTFK